MSCVHMSIHDFPQIMSSSSILKSPGGSRVGRQASNKQAVKQASTWGGIQSETCPIEACYLITWRPEPRQGQAET